MTRVFVDASAWVALGRAGDDNAFKARAHLKRLTGARATYVTTNWTLYEALAVTRRAGWRLMVSLYEHASEVADVVGVDAATEETALERVLRWYDKSASVVDHANALVAVATDCDTIVSFDADFIPLAAAIGVRLLN